MQTRISFDLPDSEAIALAQLVKRIGYAEMRTNAVSDEECEVMVQAIYKLQDALAQAGFSPR